VIRKVLVVRKVILKLADTEDDLADVVEVEGMLRNCKCGRQVIQLGIL
jgi:hypothetical protein